MHTIQAKIWVKLSQGTDPEDAAATLAHGLKRQLESFPGGEIVKADVSGIYETPEGEIEEEGLQEEQD